MSSNDRLQRPISTDMLNAFVHVAQTKNLSQAAAALDVGKSLVSKRIAQLEDKLGTTLFSRSTRKVALTPAGETYLEFAHSALNKLSDGLERVRAIKSELTGVVRVTASVSWGQRVLAKHLPEFLRLHPSLEIELILSDKVMDLANERMDMALRWSSAAPHEFNSTPLTEVGWLLAAAPRYLALAGQPSTPPELAQHDCLYYRRDNTDDIWTLVSERSQPQTHQEKLHIRVGGRYRVDNPEAVHESALAGLGIALLPDYLCEDALAQGALVQVLPDWTPQTKFGTHVVALCTPERMKLSRNRALLDHLRKALAK